MAIQPNVTPAHLLQFKKMVEELGHIPDADFKHLAEVMHYMEVDKKQVFLQEGQVCRHFYFILEGAVRSYSVHQGKEVNVEFYFENEITADFFSLRYETPAGTILESIEPCKLLYAAKKNYHKVIDNSLPLTSALVRFFQIMFFNEEEHSMSFKSFTPEERYQYILEHQPHLIQRIPLTFLASYLGMSRETLSRIRSRI